MEFITFYIPNICTIYISVIYTNIWYNILKGKKYDKIFHGNIFDFSGTNTSVDAIAKFLKLIFIFNIPLFYGIKLIKIFFVCC